MKTVYRTAVRIEPICKNGSHKMGVNACCSIWTDESPLKIEAECFGKSEAESLEKLQSFLSSSGEAEVYEMIPGPAGEMIRSSIIVWQAAYAWDPEVWIDITDQQFESMKDDSSSYEFRQTEANPYDVYQGKDKWNLEYCTAEKIEKFNLIGKWYRDNYKQH